MAGSDIFALLITLAIICGVILVVLYVNQGISNTLQITKENLKTRGYDVSRSGISIKTDKRFCHEDYLDATQRGFVRVLGASSAGSDGKPVLGRFSHAQQGTANRDESAARHGEHSLGRFSLGHHAKPSSTVDNAESTEKHEEREWFSLGRHAKQSNATNDAESTGRQPGEQEKGHLRRLWKGKQPEKDSF